MANIKTITEIFWSGSNDSSFQAASGSYEEERLYLEDHEANCETKTAYLLKQKIDELIAEVNALKNQ